MMEAQNYFEFLFNEGDMNMKMLMAAVIALSSITAFAQTYNVDSGKSKITYVGKKVTGEHTGNVTIKSGTLKFDGDKITGGELVADMDTITSTDIENAEYNKKYVDHMKSPDFFNVAKYPTATLKVKSSKKTDKGLEVTADMTLLGKTNPVTFLVTDLKKTDKTVSAKTNLTLDRTKWDLKYGSASFFKSLGDKAIHNDFTLSVDILANAK